MDLLKLQIRLSFIEAQLGQATWRDIEFGLEQELVAPDAVEQFAVEQMQRGASSPVLTDLVMAEHAAVSRPLVHRLAASEPAADDVRDRWLFLVLAWLFEGRDELPDAFEAVEVAYADFGYPEKVAPFVRYMPSGEPPASDLAPNLDRLVGRWERFLREERQRLTGSA